MADYAALIQNLVGNAFTGILAPGGLTETISLRYKTGEGVYDPENDTINTTYSDTDGVIAIAAKPTFEDVRDHNVVFSNTKLILQGVQVPSDLQVETDKVVRNMGTEAVPNLQEWNVTKTVGVPGRGIFIVFIART